MNNSLRRTMCSLAVLVGSASLVLAQQATRPAQPQPAQPRLQPGQPGQPGQFGQPGRPQAQSQRLEPSIITLAIIDNNKEIAFGQLGKQTSHNDQVKEFCDMIIKEHSDFVQKLQEHAGARGQTQRIGSIPGAAQPGSTAAQPPRPLANTGAGGASQQGASPTTRQDETAQNRNEQEQGQESRTTATERNESRQAQSATQRQQGQSEERITVAKPVISNQPGSELLQLHQEVADACLESARRDAQKMSAEEFDQHFLGAQIVAHKEMLDKIKVFEQHLSPQTKQLFADAERTTKEHLQHAEQLHQELSKGASREGRDSSSTSRNRPGAREKESTRDQDR